MASSDEHDEQQQEEIEALESIFESTVTVVRAEAPRIVDIRLLPLPDEGKEANHVGVTLRIMHTPDYPDSTPRLELRDVRGISEAMQGELLRAALATAEEMEGMAVGLPVAEVVREWLEAHNEKPSDGSMYSQMMEREKRKTADQQRELAEAERHAKIDEEFRAARRQGAQDRHLDRESMAAIAAAAGTPVTVETFAEWRANFLKEVEAKAVEAVEARAAAGNKAAAAAASAGSAPGGPSIGDGVAIDGMGAIGTTFMSWERTTDESKTGRELFMEASTVRAAEADEVAAAAAALRAAEEGGGEEDKAAAAAAAAATAAVGDMAVFLDSDEEDDLDDLDDLDDEEDDEPAE